MADVAISGLPAAASVAGTDVAPVSQGATTRKATAAQLSTYVRTQVTKSDVGLGNADNTSDADKPLSDAAVTALAGKQPLDTDLTAIAGLTPSVDDILQYKGTAWSNRTLTQVKADLLAVASAWTFAGAAANTNSVTVSGTGLGSNAALIISSVSPCFTLDDTDAGTNARRWNFRATGTSWIAETINNADAGQKQFLHVQRASASTDIALMIYGNSTDNPPHSFRGDIRADIAGRGFQIKEGSNARMGVATLVAGSVVVSNTSVTATTRIFVTSQSDGGTPGFVRVSARTAGTSFTLTSSSGADTSTVAWQLVEPAP